MRENIQILQKQRFYSESFKKELVQLFESGKYSVLQLSRLYGVHASVIYTWIYKFSNFNEKGVRVVEMQDSHSDKLKALEQQVKELERIIGQKQIKIDFLDKLIDVASEQLNVDIKKNFNTQPSTGSGKTKSG
jgi:transposase-like protein